MTDPQIYEPFENCKGLKKKYMEDPRGGAHGWHDPFLNDRYTLAYYVVGFTNVFVVYDWEEDKVLWFQNVKGTPKPKRGVRVWEAMRSEYQKLFLFNIDWFIGD